MTNMQNNTDENFNEDFERLLKEFVSEKYKDVKLDDMQTEDDEDPFLEDEDEDEYEAEDDTPIEKADDICTDSPLPGDVIEQNQNVRVKVEILRPIDNPQEELQKLVGWRQHQEAHGRTGGADRLQPHAARTVSRTEAAPGFAAQPIPRQPRHGQDHGLQDIRGAAARGGSALERTRRGVRPRHLHRHALGRRGKGDEASGGDGAGRRPDD